LIDGNRRIRRRCTSKIVECDEARNLVGGVAVRVYEKAAIALPDVLDEEVDEQRGLSHAAHPLDIDVLGVY
jgi:hypothetical protein